MWLCVLSVVLFFFLRTSFFFSNSASSRAPPARLGTKLSDDEKKEGLNEMNRIRANLAEPVSSLPKGKVPPLEWNTNLEKFAQTFADTCPRGHNQANNLYGENIAWGGRETLVDAVDRWDDERKNVNTAGIGTSTWIFTTTPNSTWCPSGWANCAHLTQQIWGKTRYVGCARSQGCTKVAIVCNYDPAGNWSNQKVYG